MSVFNPDPEVTEADRTRLGPHLISYRHLNELFVINPEFPTDDLKKLVLMELGGKRREVIFQKLVGRIKGRERREVLTNLEVEILKTTR